MRRASKVLLLVLGAAGAAVAILRLRAGGTRPRVDLYSEDGSLTSVGEDSAGGARLLGLARELQRAAAG